MQMPSPAASGNLSLSDASLNPRVLWLYGELFQVPALVPYAAPNAPWSRRGGRLHDGT